VIEFLQGSDGVGRATLIALGNFPVEVERHDKARFQKDGHFVPAMVDANGFRRDWDGPLVFCGTIWQEVRDVQGQLTGRNQVLRVLADTPQELLRLFDLNIRDTFFALWQAQQLQANTFERMRVEHDEHNELIGWMGENFPGLDTDGLTSAGIAKAAVVRLKETIRMASELHRDRVERLIKRLPWWVRLKDEDA
jgi:hypothetical protein